MQIPFPDLVRYFLTAVLLNQAYNYQTTNSLALEMNPSSIIFFLALGIVFYWIYRPIYFDLFFLRFLDLCVIGLRKIKILQEIDNYKLFLKREENIKYQSTLKVYYNIKKKFTGKLYSQSDKLKASTIHFFAMASFMFLFFSILNLDFKPEWSNRTLFVVNEKFYNFLLFSFLTFIYAVFLSIQYQCVELDYILKIKNGNKKEKYKKFMDKQRYEYGSENI